MFPDDNEEWGDFDGDGIGDNADTDDDGDGCEDSSDDLPTNANESLTQMVMELVTTQIRT